MKKIYRQPELPQFEIPEDLKKFEKEIMEWLAYKNQRREKYVPIGLRALFKRLRKIKNIPAAIEISMAGGWKGVWEDRDLLRKQNKSGIPDESTEWLREKGRRQMEEIERIKNDPNEKGELPKVNFKKIR